MKIMRDVMFKDNPQRLWSEAEELSLTIFNKYKTQTNTLTLRKILEEMLTGDNIYRVKDFQEALRILENGGNLKRLIPKSNRVKNFKDDEEFIMVYNENNEIKKT